VCECFYGRLVGSSSARDYSPRFSWYFSTMENALLGDSMIEKLRASGTAAEKEKHDAMGERGCRQNIFFRLVSIERQLVLCAIVS
jgi:hypothetical protein